MLNRMQRWACCAALTLGVTAAQAATLTVTPSNHAALLGDLINVTVEVSGLVAGGAPSLGAFDVDLSYDEDILSIAGLSYGTGLDVEGLGSLRFSDASALGSINVGEVSLDSETVLEALQSSSFGLFTLTFRAIGTGTSALSLDIHSLADAAGSALQGNVVDGGIVVGVVPLPASAWLLLSGFAGLVGFARKRGA